MAETTDRLDPSNARTAIMAIPPTQKNARYLPRKNYQVPSRKMMMCLIALNLQQQDAFAVNCD